MLAIAVNHCKIFAVRAFFSFYLKKNENLMETLFSTLNLYFYQLKSHQKTTHFHEDTHHNPWFNLL